MEQPPPGPDPASIPNQPPKLDTRQLWLTLLLPGALTAACMVALITAGSQAEEIIFNVGSTLVTIATIACWIGFAKCLNKRFEGASRILLILAYPLAQAVLIFVIFFAGCLIMIAQPGKFY